MRRKRKLAIGAKTWQTRSSKDRRVTWTTSTPGLTKRAGRTACWRRVMLAGGLTPRLISTLERLNVSARMVRLDMIRMNDDADGSLLESELLFAIDVNGPALRLTEGGWRFIWERADVPTTAFEVVQMLRARVVHDSDEDYVIDEDRVTLVDPLDGRPMHSHRYMDGLHEALEAKEGIEGRGT